MITLILILQLSTKNRPVPLYQTYYQLEVDRDYVTVKLIFVGAKLGFRGSICVSIGIGTIKGGIH